jgi:anti-sigma B factor antagonist
MTLVTHGNTLRVEGLTELNATNAASFRDQVRAALQGGHTQVDLDLNQTRFIDSSGLGSLIAIHKTLCGRQGIIRLINPTSQVLQILELTRMHRIFEIAKS